MEESSLTEAVWAQRLRDNSAPKQPDTRFSTSVFGTWIWYFSWQCILVDGAEISSTKTNSLGISLFSAEFQTSKDNCHLTVVHRIHLSWYIYRHECHKNQPIHVAGEQIQLIVYKFICWLAEDAEPGQRSGWSFLIETQGLGDRFHGGIQCFTTLWIWEFWSSFSSSFRRKIHPWLKKNRSPNIIGP